jgi:hypothetical protein
MLIVKNLFKLPDICHMLNTLDPGHVDGDKSEKNRCMVLSFLATMLFQTQKGHAWTEEAVDAVRCFKAVVVFKCSVVYCPCFLGLEWTRLISGLLTP